MMQREGLRGLNENMSIYLNNFFYFLLYEVETENS